jgi:hypothetical protein
LENKTLTAYHESARVVFTYLNNYTCDAMELPEEGGSPKSKLNAGKDRNMVQAILSGNKAAQASENLPQSTEVAKKLMAIYCAGTCARIYYNNDLKVPSELQFDISGQDLAMMEKLQSFLKKALVDHPDDFPSTTVVSIFKQIKQSEVWKAIEMLSEKILAEEDKTLSRFHIEDALMVAGIKIHKATTKSGFGLGLHEDDSTDEKIHNEAISFKEDELSPLDIVVRDFLKQIKSDWQEKELKSATAHLHKIYNKYSN